MSTLTDRPGVTVRFPSCELTGTLVHDPATASLVLTTDEGPEVLSVNLETYGCVPEPGCVFVKDWSEHSGLAAALEKDGIGRILSSVSVGPFGSTAYELLITID